MTAGDRAGGTYWDGVWRNAEIIAPADPGITGRNNYVERRFAEFFRHALGDGKGKKLLEVGAANSAWLPYFAIHQGFNVAGLDYSDGGCAQARAVLQRAGVAGTITCADMFDPPEALVGAFDSVVSFGVVEHFERVEDAVRAVATFCSPGGIVATVVPNMTGLIGALQRRLNEPVFRLHVPLDPPRLAAAHAAAGLRIDTASYFIATDFGVVNLDGLPGGVSTRRKHAVLRWVVRLSKAAWVLEERLGMRFPATRSFAPYVVVVGRRPGARSALAGSRSSAAAEPQLGASGPAGSSTSSGPA